MELQKKIKILNPHKVIARLQTSQTFDDFYAVLAILCWSEIFHKLQIWCSSPPFLLAFSDFPTTLSYPSNNRQTSSHPHPLSSLLLCCAYELMESSSICEALFLPICGVILIHCLRSKIQIYSRAYISFNLQNNFWWKKKQKIGNKFPPLLAHRVKLLMRASLHRIIV